MTDRIIPNTQEKEIEDAGGYGNWVLYRMCQERPGHTDPRDVSSKLWLIGRAYSAPLERRAGGERDFLKNVSRELSKMSIDGLINEVDGISYLDQDNLHKALRVHSAFNGMLRKLAKINRPSLASKYLHFHRPNAFFIFDTVVSRNVRIILKERGVPLRELRVPAEWNQDSPYPAFCIRAMRYRDMVMPGSTPRAVDRALYPY